MPAFQKRHYETVAQVIHTVVADGRAASAFERRVAQETVELVATRLAGAFATDNTLFRPLQFLKACGVK